MSDPGLEWRATLKGRIVVAAALFGLWTVGVEARLVYLQVFRHADLMARAARQQSRTLPTPAKRGDILDRRGNLLATTVDVDSIYAVPSEISNDDEVAAKLCSSFGDCSGHDRDALADRLKNQRNFAYVRRQVSPEEARRVAALNLDGIGFIKESQRFYPNKELAAHLLGYVGIDGKGLEGLEWTYDSQIRGLPGTVLIHTDARRHAFSRFERPPTTGSTIELTIDEYLQNIAERELHAGIIEHRAAGGSAIVLDPHTGEILAMANEPTFNPNAYRQSGDAERRNRAVQDLYEPGSTFKLVTASAAIEDKVIPLDTMIDTSPGVIHVGSGDIHDTANHGVLSFSDVIADSSNVGAVKIGLRVGTERLSRFIQQYGFGHAVSSDFPGESPGIVWRPEKWTESALAHVAIGYQIAVTPLQMLAAVGSIANGGEYVEPRVIRAVDRNNRRYVVRPKVVRRTVSADTAATLTTIMEGVVDHGTAKIAQIPGYTVAGKTGTAAKLIDGRYSKSEYNASFVAFLPSRNPVVAIIVVIDSPHGKGYYGGVVAAPIFKRIAESTLRYLGVGPTIDPEPPVIVDRRDTADVRAQSQNESQPIVSFVADGPPGTVPDLQGMSAREAVRQLVRLGLTARLSGDGFVMSQDPPAGTVLEPGSVCSLVLDRWAARSDQVVQP
jgi:cell division protein FtsI (penicillin-binding protein 3)